MTDEKTLPEGTYGTWDGKQWHPGALGVWDGLGFVALGLGNPALNSTPRGPVAHPCMTDGPCCVLEQQMAGLDSRLRTLEALVRQRQERQRDADDEGSGHYASPRKHKDR